MKVFMISRGYPTPEYKMNGIFEMDQAKALVNKGIDLVFLSIDLRSIRRKRKFGEDFFIKDGVKVYSIDWPVGNIPKSIFYKISEKALFKTYKRAIKKEGKPDILHAYFTDQAYIAAKLSEKEKIPLVITEPNSHINVENIEPNLKKAAEYAYNKADRLITVSPDFQRKVLKKFGIDSSVITILPDLKTFEYSKRDKENKEFKIVSTGRLTKLKGMAELIEAFNIAFSEDENVKLKIFGGGPEKENLQKMINNYRLEERIKLMGLVDRAIIAKEYADSDLFCLYSHMETFGLAYLEALASGLPVISSRCGGPEHLINEENGILVKLFDKKEFVESLKYMKENINKYDKKRISEDTKTRYSIDNITGKLIDVYERVLRNEFK